MSDLRYWQNSELYNHVRASQAGQPQVTANDGQSTQQNYLLSAPVNSYEDPTPVDTQHQFIHGANSTSNEKVLAPSAARQPSHDAYGFPCLWTSFQRQCNFSADTINSMLTHISSQHLRKKQSPDSRVECHICSPPTTLRRDTLRRHIREKHYGDRSRCRHSS